MEKPINFLVDTNIWLERLLDQEKSQEVNEFLQKIPSENLSVSDFSLHSIGIILAKTNKIELFKTFAYDLFFTGNVSLLTLINIEIISIAQEIEVRNLDFDDAYQSVVSKKYNIDIVTFD